MIGPRARGDLAFHPQRQAHGPAAVHVRDPGTGRWFRLDEIEALLLAAMDGSRSEEDLAALMAARGRRCPVELVRDLTVRAARLGLLEGEPAPRRQRGVLDRLFFFRIPLADPDPWLGGPARLWAWAASRRVVPFLVLFVLGALWGVFGDLPRAARAGLEHLTPAAMPWLLAVVAGVKIAHELGHAAAARRHGCRVRELGVAFLVFLPCLYVEISSAWALPRRRQRLEIGAAGIAVELLLGAAAAYLWRFTGPGPVNSAALYVMAVAWLASLLVNANPLMRFDGYFVLADLLGLPNLGPRAFARLRYLIRNRWLGWAEALDPARSGREARLLTVYGIAAGLYRPALGLLVAGAIRARVWGAAGLGLGAVVVWTLLVRPLVREVRFAWRLEPRPAAAVAAVLGSLLLAGAAVPFPRQRVFPCVLEPADPLPLLAPRDGIVAVSGAREGRAVRMGEALLELRVEDAQHRYNLARIDLALKSREFERAEAAGEDLARLVPEVEQARDALARAQENLERGVLAAPAAGLVVEWSPGLDPGAPVARGAQIGLLADPCRTRACALVEESDLAGLGENTPVSVWIPLRGGVLLAGRVARIDRYSLEDLGASPMAAAQGGPVPTRGAPGRQAPLVPAYRVQVDLETAGAILPFGLRGRLLQRTAGLCLAARLQRALSKALFREEAL